MVLHSFRINFNTNLSQYDQNDKEDSKLNDHIIVLNKKLIKIRTYIVTTVLKNFISKLTFGAGRWFAGTQR